MPKMRIERCATLLERANKPDPKTERVLTGEMLKGLRESFGISQLTVAKDLGVAINAYRQWEEGTFYPSEKNYKKISRYFGVKDEADIVEALAIAEMLNKQQQGAEL